MAMRKKFEPAIKARVALEALKGEKTAAQISSEYGVHATQVTQWKQAFGDISEAESFTASSREPDISVSLARPGCCETQSSMVLGYYIHSISVGLRVSGGGCRLVQPMRLKLAAVEYAGS